MGELFTKTGSAQFASYPLRGVQSTFGLGR